MVHGRRTRTVFGLGIVFTFALAWALAAQSQPAASAKPGKEAKPADRNVWNLAGGAFFETDGGLPNGACFRLSGHVTAPGFFDGLKRIDGASETTYRRGAQTVTHFPDQLFVTFSIKDAPCSPDLEQTAARPPLTPEMLQALRLRLYWKRGVVLRPIEDAEITGGSMKALEPYASDLAKELPQRFEWFYSLKVASGDVPLTDSLVFVLETPDGRIAARVAARL